MDRELPSSKRSSTRLKKKTTSNKFIQKLEISNRELPSKSTPKNRPGQSKRSKVNLLDTPKYFDSDEYTETNPPAIDLDIIKNPKYLSGKETAFSKNDPELKELE